MKNKLPSVYANNIDKKINNVQELYYGKDNREEKKYSLNEIIKKINEIFHSPNHVYKSIVIITINGIESLKTIVGRSGNYLFTLDGEKININSIEDIKKRS